MYFPLPSKVRPRHQRKGVAYIALIMVVSAFSMIIMSELIMAGAEGGQHKANSARKHISIDRKKLDLVARDHTLAHLSRYDGSPYAFTNTSLDSFCQRLAALGAPCFPQGSLSMELVPPGTVYYVAAAQLSNPAGTSLGQGMATSTLLSSNDSSIPGTLQQFFRNNYANIYKGPQQTYYVARTNGGDLSDRTYTVTTNVAYVSPLTFNYIPYIRKGTEPHPARFATLATLNPNNSPYFRSLALTSLNPTTEVPGTIANHHVPNLIHVESSSLIDYSWRTNVDFGSAMWSNIFPTTRTVNISAAALSATSEGITQTQEENGPTLTTINVAALPNGRLSYTASANEVVTVDVGGESDGSGVMLIVNGAGPTRVLLAGDGVRPTTLVLNNCLVQGAGMSLNGALVLSPSVFSETNVPDSSIAIAGSYIVHATSYPINFRPIVTPYLSTTQDILTQPACCLPPQAVAWTVITEN